MNMRFWMHARCLRPVSGPTSGTTTSAAVSSSTRPTSTMPTNGAGSTRGPASRHGRRDLTRFVLWHSFLDSSACRFRPTPSSSYWQVWQDALDLTQSGGSGEVHCHFHYTTQVGFRNITAPSKKAVEVFVLHSVTNQHVMWCHVSFAACWQPQTSWRPQGFPCDWRSNGQCVVGTRQV